jgi:tetratricopeptide (TPR) repeat protein
MRKGGTVHIADRAAFLPFDVQAYRVITYSTDLSEIDRVVTEISSAIKRRLEQPDRSDNPVHDTFPALPISYFSTSEESLRLEMEARLAAITRLEKERDQLVARLRLFDSAFSLEADQPSLPDIDELLNEANNALTEAGQPAILRLTRIAEAQGRDAFVEELRNALKSAYLTENDLSEISNLCSRLGLDEHQRAVLLLASSRFPSTMEFRLMLAQRSLRSPHPAVREQGRVLTERLLQLHLTPDGSFECTRPNLEEESINDLFGALADHLEQLGNYEMVVKIADAVAAVVGNNSTILRNKARALSHLGRTDEADSAFRAAIEVDPTDDTAVSFYGVHLDRVGRYQDAFELDVRALLIDPEDPTRWFNLAIQVYNRGVIPTADESAFQQVSRLEKRKLAIPLVLEGLRRVDHETAHVAAVIQRAIEILVRMGAMREAELVADGQVPQGDFNPFILDYMRRRLSDGQGAPDKIPYRGQRTQPLPEILLDGRLPAPDIDE